MYAKKLGERLRKARTRKGLNQKEAAKLFNITPGRLSHYENGRANPPQELLTEMAKTYAVSGDYILGLNILETEVPEGQLEVFRERLNELRIKKGLSRLDLAEFVGVSEEKIKEWEFNCTELPTATELFYLAAPLDVTPDYLAGFVDSEQGISDETPKPKELEKLIEDNLLMYSGIPITARDLEKIRQALYLVFLDSIKQKQKKEQKEKELDKSNNYEK